MREEHNYLIYAYEESYGGLHGMYSLDFVRCTEKEAIETAIEMSYEVMDSYACIEDYLREDCESDEEYEEARRENVAYEVFELREDIPSYEELCAMNYDWEEYVRLYGAKEDYGLSSCSQDSVF